MGADAQRGPDLYLVMEMVGRQPLRQVGLVRRRGLAPYAQAIEFGIRAVGKRIGSDHRPSLARTIQPQRHELALPTTGRVIWRVALVPGDGTVTLIELLSRDVDGVLTDGRLAFGSVGEPQKSFFTRDGHAIKTWQRSGGRLALLSGRREQATTNRAAELGIESG